MHNLQKVRQSRELTQLSLSVASNCNLRTLQDYEINRKNIDRARLDTLVNLCLALQCKLSEIVEDPVLIEKLKKLEKLWVNLE